MKVVNKFEGVLSEDSQRLYDAIVDRLKEQEDQVTCVQFMENFSKDYDLSLKMNTPVAQGVLVSVKGDYKLNQNDYCWFTPELFKTSSVYESTIVNDTFDCKEQETGNNVQLNAINSIIGHYKNTQTDNLGVEKTTHYLVVENSLQYLTQELVSEWLAEGKSVKDVYTELSENFEIDNVDLSHFASNNNQKMAQKSVGSKMVLSHEQQYNRFMNDGANFNFYNSCVPFFQNDTALIRSNPLSGYQLYQNESKTASEWSAFPTTHAQEATFMKWENLSISHKNRVSDCSWEGGAPFNTLVMREWSTAGTKPHMQLNMVKAKISSNNVISEMSPSQIVDLTPTENENVSCPMNTAHPMLRLVLDNYSTLQKNFDNLDIINPKYIQGDKIHLPKNVVSSLL